MKSIRTHLLVWLLGGVTVLITAAGCAVYWAAGSVLMDQVETELQLARKAVYNLYQRNALTAGAFQRGTPSTQRTPRLGDDERWRAFDVEDGDLLYQLRSAAGDVVARSPSLRNRTIEAPGSIDDPRESVAITLPDGTRLRARIDHARPPGRSAANATGSEDRGSPVEIIVARDLGDVSRKLNWISAAIMAAGLLLAALTGAYVSLVLHRGLASLNQLGADAARIDAASLTARFGDGNLPKELHSICDRLNDLLERLQGSFERERRFSADLAHELRTPLAELKTTAEAAIRFPGKVTPAAFKDVLASTEEMQAVVESLLALARREREDSELDLQEVGLGTLLSEVWAPFSSGAAEREIKVAVECPSDAVVAADPALLRSILGNLFSNAVEYTTSGGEISIRAFAGATHPSPLLSVGNSAGDLMPSDVAQLFDRFWRRDPSRSARGHSGLGLSVARACSEALGLRLTARLQDGWLWFDLTPGVPALSPTRKGTATAAC